MFIIAKGEVKVLVTNEKKKTNVIKSLRPGEFFGEIALIYGCVRSADVINQKYSTFAKLDKNSYL